MLYRLFLLFLSFYFASCGKKLDQEDISVPSNLSGSQEDIYTSVEVIKKRLNYDQSEWTIVLMGNNEYLTKDICKGDTTCDINNSDAVGVLDFPSYSSLDNETKSLISKVNTYFQERQLEVQSKPTGDYRLLNEINPYLGGHDLFLLKTSVIKKLHESLYGNNFWPNIVDAQLEAFANSNYTIFVFCNKNPSAAGCITKTSWFSADKYYPGSDKIDYTYLGSESTGTGYINSCSSLSCSYVDTDSTSDSSCSYSGNTCDYTVQASIKTETGSAQGSKTNLQVKYTNTEYVVDINLEWTINSSQSSCSSSYSMIYTDNSAGTTTETCWDGTVL